MAHKRQIRLEKRQHKERVWAALSVEERQVQEQKAAYRRERAREKRQAKTAEKKKAAAEVQRVCDMHTQKRLDNVQKRVRGAGSYLYSSYVIDVRRMSPVEYQFHLRNLTIAPREARVRCKKDGSVDKKALARDANYRKKNTIPLYGQKTPTTEGDPFFLRVPPQYGRRVWGEAEVDCRSHGKPLPPGLEFKAQLWGPQDPFDQQHVAALTEPHVIKEKRGGLLELPTSCGKTLLMIWVIVVLLRRKALIVLPMLAIHTQMIMRLQQFVPGIRVGSIQGETYDVADKDVVVAMVHTLAQHPEYMTRVEFDDFGCVMYDEVDRMATLMFSSVLIKLSRIRYVFGWSATMERANGMDALLEPIFGAPIYSAPRSTKQNRLTTIVRLRYDEGDTTVLYRESKKDKKLREAREALSSSSSSSSSGDSETTEIAWESERYGYGDEEEDAAYDAYDSDDTAIGGEGNNSNNKNTENEEIDIPAMAKRLTTDETRHAYVMRLLLALLERGRRVAVLVTDIEYAKRIVKECQEAFPSKLMVHYAQTLKPIDREDIDRVAHDLIVASFQIFAVGIDLAYLDTLVFAMPRRTITQAAGRLRAVARGWLRHPLFIFDLIDTFGMYNAQASARCSVYREKRFSLLEPCAIGDYVIEPSFPDIPVLTPEEDAQLDEEMRVAEEARQQRIVEDREKFERRLAAIRKRHGHGDEQADDEPLLKKSRRGSGGGGGE